jgi:hypothetical protein
VTAQPGFAQQFAPRLQAGVHLGDYVLGQPLFPLRIADAYRANGPAGAATVYVVHAPIAADANVRQHIVAGTRSAAALPEHRHFVRTLAAGLTGDILWIATEEVDGSLVRDMLTKKKQAGTPGFGVRGTANLISGVAGALSDALHGALAAESVIVSRTGRVRVIDLALGAGTVAAMLAGLVPQQSCIAPEVLAGNAPTSASDVYSVGALLYEALVGAPLERGGPRPSDVVKDTNKQIDEIVARACHRDPDKRFGRVDVLGEVVGEGLSKGGVVMTVAVPKFEPGPELGAQVPEGSLATEIAAQSPAASGNVVVDRALGAALADTTEKWLISKGRLDYGPFSLADVVAQIDKGDIVAGNLIMDKDTGARVDIGEHPLLGPMIDAAKQRMDDQRRAQAEVVVQSREKTRGALLYLVIGLGVAGAAVGVYFIIDSMRHTDDKQQVATINGLDGAQLKVTVTLPKTPPAKHHSGGGGGGKNWGQKNASENMSLDLADDSDETETLDMGKVYAVYSHYGAQLGGCLNANGAGSANIAISIDGPSGRVNIVKVNGQATGPLWGCINRVMRTMQFPAIHGPRTRAEFDIGV